MKRVDPEVLIEPAFQHLMELHGIQPGELLALLEKQPELDPRLFASVIDFARRSYHSLDQYGSKANYGPELERILDEHWGDFQ